MADRVRPLRPADASICDAIVASLPDWFGNEDGIRECAALVRETPGIVAERDGRIVGFLTHARRYPPTAEITWIAVHAEHRHTGVGTALVEAIERELANDGARLLVVKTLSDREDPGPEYAATRAFYLARGFAPVVELDIWGPENPAQVLAKGL
ncbi:MAG: GNAT family N-acetyltransferase [Actinomycetota bacterium]